MKFVNIFSLILLISLLFHFTDTGPVYSKNVGAILNFESSSNSSGLGLSEQTIGIIVFGSIAAVIISIICYLTLCGIVVAITLVTFVVLKKKKEKAIRGVEIDEGWEEQLERYKKRKLAEPSFNIDIGYIYRKPIHGDLGFINVEETVSKIMVQKAFRVGDKWISQLKVRYEVDYMDCIDESYLEKFEDSDKPFGIIKVKRYNVEISEFDKKFLNEIERDLKLMHKKDVEKLPRRLNHFREYKCKRNNFDWDRKSLLKKRDEKYLKFEKLELQVLKKGVEEEGGMIFDKTKAETVTFHYKKKIRGISIPKLNRNSLTLNNSAKGSNVVNQQMMIVPPQQQQQQFIPQYNNQQVIYIQKNPIMNNNQQLIMMQPNVNSQQQLIVVEQPNVNNQQQFMIQPNVINSDQIIVQPKPSVLVYESSSEENESISDNKSSNDEEDDRSDDNDEDDSSGDEDDSSG